jgi:NDP-sugar pyrophosphorylase family protein
MEQELFPCWIKQGTEIVAVRHQGPFLDIGTPETLKIADRFIYENFTSGCRRDDQAVSLYGKDLVG